MRLQHQHLQRVGALLKRNSGGGVRVGFGWEGGRLNVSSVSLFSVRNTPSSSPSLKLLTKSAGSTLFFSSSSSSSPFLLPHLSSLRTFVSSTSESDAESVALKERLKRIEDLNAQGCEYMNTKLYDSAEKALKEAITLLPEASELLKKTEQQTNTQQANITAAPSALKRLISLSSKSSNQPSETELDDSEENDDPDISLLAATILNNLGMVCAEQYFSSHSSSSSSSKFEEAVEFLQESLHLRRRHRGLIHPDTSTTLSNIGAIYQRKGDHNLALNFYEEATNGLEDFLSRLQDVAASSSGSIPSLLLSSHYSPPSSSSSSSSSSLLLSTSPPLRRFSHTSILSEIHPRKLEEQLLKSRKLLAVTLNNAAISYCRLADSETTSTDKDTLECDAMNCWTRALELFEGTSSSSTASSSTTSTSSSSTSSSSSLMSSPIVDVTNPDYVTSIRNLATLHSRREEFGASIAFWKKLLRLQEEEFGKKAGTKLVPTLSSLATTLMKQARKEEEKNKKEEEKDKGIRNNIEEEAIEILSRAVQLDPSSSNLAKRLQEWKAK